MTHDEWHKTIIGLALVKRKGIKEKPILKCSLPFFFFFSKSCVGEEKGGK